MPAVSVVIPAYQSAYTLAESIQSVLDQTFRDIEVIVVDDGSTDDTEKIIDQFQSRIIFLKQENKGAAAARNNGIKHASGEFIAFLDADDTWFPDKLALQLPLFSRDPGLGLVFGNAHYLSEGKIQSKTYFDLYPPHEGNVFLKLFTVNFIPMPTVLARKEALEQQRLFNESISYVEDYELWLRLSISWRFDYVCEPVATYRLSAQQISKKFTEAARVLLSVKKSIFESNPELFSKLDRHVLNRGYYNKYLKLALCLMRDRRSCEAREVLSQYSRLRGYSSAYWVFSLVSNLPMPLMVAAIRLWDRFYQKPELGFY